MGTGTKIALVTSLITYGIAFLFSTANAEIRPEKVHTADSKQNKIYVNEGLIVGGDPAIDDVVVKNIQRAVHADFERIVFDLEGNVEGESAEIKRPPYYQLAILPEERRVTLTLWGNPKLNFDSKKVIQGFKKSAVIENVTLLPRLEKEFWTVALTLKSEYSVELFELAHPVRVVMDIQNKKTLKTKDNQLNK